MASPYSSGALKGTTNNVSVVIRLFNSSFDFSKFPMGRQYNTFLTKQPIYFKIMKFQINYKKGQTEIKAIISLDDLFPTDKAVFLHFITFIEFLGHLKG